MSEVVPLTRDSRVLVVGRYKRAPEPEKRTAIVFRVPHIPDGLSPCRVFLQGNNNHRKETSNSPSGGQIDLFCCAQTCDAICFFFLLVSVTWSMRSRTASWFAILGVSDVFVSPASIISAKGVLHRDTGMHLTPFVTASGESEICSRDMSG